MGLCRELAVVNESAVANLKLPLHRDFDDLDAYSYVVIEAGARTFALRLYDHQPNPGFTLIGMQDSSNSSEQISDFLQASCLPGSAIIWQNPQLSKNA